AGGATADAKAAKVKAGGKPAKKKPVMMMVLGFYAVLGLVIIMAMGGGEAAATTDPGEGPYLDWMLRAPLQWDMNEEHRRDVYEHRWWTTKDEERMAPDARKAIAARVYDAAFLRARIPDADRKALADKRWAKANTEHGA